MPRNHATFTCSFVVGVVLLMLLPSASPRLLRADTDTTNGISFLHAPEADLFPRSWHHELPAEVALDSKQCSIAVDVHKKLVYMKAFSGIYCIKTTGEMQWCVSISDANVAVPDSPNAQVNGITRLYVDEQGRVWGAGDGVRHLLLIRHTGAVALIDVLALLITAAPEISKSIDNPDRAHLRLFFADELARGVSSERGGRGTSARSVMLTFQHGDVLLVASLLLTDAMEADDWADPNALLKVEWVQQFTTQTHLPVECVVVARGDVTLLVCIRDGLHVLTIQADDASSTSKEEALPPGGPYKFFQNRPMYSLDRANTPFLLLASSLRNLVSWVPAAIGEAGRAVQFTPLAFDCVLPVLADHTTDPKLVCALPTGGIACLQASSEMLGPTLWSVPPQETRFEPFGIETGLKFVALSDTTHDMFFWNVLNSTVGLYREMVRIDSLTGHIEVQSEQVQYDAPVEQAMVSNQAILLTWFDSAQTHFMAVPRTRTTAFEPIAIRHTSCDEHPNANPGSDQHSPPSPASRHPSGLMFVGVAILGVVLAVIVCAAVCVLWRRRRGRVDYEEMQTYDDDL
mmetsp:Transcript_12395/g.31443  ORF Transcript_12395/g.31443 Transcript_12395/m.31443 type:complete len:572 (-) Transcript_12395:213-1928(-)